MYIWNSWLTISLSEQIELFINEGYRIVSVVATKYDVTERDIKQAIIVYEILPTGK